MQSSPNSSFTWLKRAEMYVRFTLSRCSFTRSQLETFRKQLSENGADFPSAFSSSLYDLTQKMLPKRKKPAEQKKEKAAPVVPINPHHPHKEAQLFPHLARADTKPMSVDDVIAADERARAERKGKNAGDDDDDADMSAGSGHRANQEDDRDSDAKMSSGSSGSKGKDSKDSSDKSESSRKRGRSPDRESFDRSDKKRRSRSPDRAGASGSSGSSSSRPRTDTPQVGAIYDGEVSRVMDFGAFVSLKGFPGRVEGLVHVSAIKVQGRIQNLKEYLKPRQAVKVKVQTIAGAKIALSMRDVDQDTGEDLRPSRAGAAGDSAAGKARASADDLRANPSRPEGGPTRVAREDDSGRQVKRMSEAEKWELTQLMSSGAIPVAERPDLDDEQGILGLEEQEEELEIELNEEEPNFLKGAAQHASESSPIKVVKNPDGSMQRAALTQSALSKERRELREQQTKNQVDSVPRDLGRSWEDPMAKPGERYLAQEVKNVGMSAIEHMPQWKKEQMSKHAFVLHSACLASLVCLVGFISALSA